MNPIQQPPRKPNSDCHHCDLSGKGITTCLPAEGPRQSDIMIVAEKLGQAEDEQGIACAGDPGRKLDYCLEGAGLRRKDLKVVKLVRCKPGKKPTKKQITACAPHTLYNILIDKPKVIVTLGAQASETLISDWSYKFQRPDGSKVAFKRKLDHERGFPRKETFFYVSPKRVYKHTCWVIPSYSMGKLFKADGCRLDPLATWDLNTARRYAEGDEFLQMPDTNIIITDTMPKVEKLFRKLVSQETFTHDLETTGLDPHRDQIVCAGFGWKDAEAWVLPWLDQSVMGQPYVNHWSSTEQETIIRDLRQVLEHSKLIGQGIKFDLKFLRKWLGIESIPVAFDTLVGAHLLNETTPSNLTFQAQQDLGWLKYDSPSDPYKKDKLCNLAHAPQQMVRIYCGQDIDATHRLKKIQTPKIRSQNLITCYKTAAGLIQPFVDIEFVGVRADSDRLMRLSKKYRAKQDKCRQYLLQKAVELLPEEESKDFNPNSTQQLTKLFQAAGAQFKKKTPSGSYSMTGNVMAAFALTKNQVGRLAQKVIDLRSTVKFVSTYLDGKDGDGGVLQFIHPVTLKGVTTDRICASYNAVKTVTGRLSAERWITFPKKGGVRGIIIPDDPESWIISVDYAKAELCVMSWLANDWTMINELTNGIDLHSHMAITMELNRPPTLEEFNIMLPDVDPNKRAVAKQVIFGVGYGRQAAGIVEAYPDIFPSDMKKWDRINVVEKIIQAFWEKYPAIYDFMQEQIRTAKQKGFLRTQLTGRIRHFEAACSWFRSKHSLGCEKREEDIQAMERQAMNFGTQAQASDELHKATRRVGLAIPKANIPGLRIMMSIHDQLLFNCRKLHTEQAIPLIKKHMQTILPKGRGRKYDVPLLVDPDLMSVWGEGISGETQY